MVPAESPAAENPLVPTRQQQLRRDRLTHFAALFQRKQTALPKEFLSQGKAFRHEAHRRRTGCVCFPCRRSADGFTGRVATHSAKAGGRNLARDGPFHRDPSRKKNLETRTGEGRER